MKYTQTEEYCNYALAIPGPLTREDSMCTCRRVWSGSHSFTGPCPGVQVKGGDTHQQGDAEDHAQLPSSTWTAGAPASDLEGTCQEPLSYKCIKQISLRKRGIYWKNTVEALRPDGGVEPLVGMSQNSQEPGGQTRTRNWKASGTDLALVPLPSCSGLCRLHYSGYCFILLTAGWIGVGDRPSIDLALNFGFATEE